MTWLKSLTQQVGAERHRRLLGPDAGSLLPEEVALATLHVGLGHLLGHEAEDLALDGYLSASSVNSLISRVWRSGDIQPAIVRLLPQAWTAFFCVGRDSSLVRPAFLEALLRSSVGKWVAEGNSHNLDPHVIDTRLEAAVDELGDVSREKVQEVLGATSASLDCDDSHIWVVRALSAKNSDWFTDSPATLLENVAAFADDAAETSAIEDLARAARVQVVDRSMPGSWPDRTTGRIPSWVRQTVLHHGARFYNGTVGFVPSWIFVAESDEELRAFERWTYQPGLGIDPESGGSSVRLCLPLEFTASSEFAYAWYNYDLLDAIDQLHLRTLVAVGFLRVDAYKLTPESDLEFQFSIGSQIPPEFSDQLRQILDASDPDWRIELGVKPGREMLEMMAMLDRHNFELVQRCQPIYRSDPGSKLATSYRRYLDVTHAASTAKSLRMPFDEELLKESHEDLRAELARNSSTRPIGALSLNEVGPNRAYLQFRATAEDRFLEVFAAWHRSEAPDEPGTRRWEFSQEISINCLPLEPLARVEALRSGLAQLRELLHLGVQNLVVSLDPATYHLPIHHALQALGFAEVTFVHAISALRSSVATNDPPTATVAGWPGEGNEYIESVEIETKGVRSLYGAAGSASGQVDVLHLSGHAWTGFAVSDVYLKFAPDSLASAASALRDFAGSSRLVFLAACGTGSASFKATQLVETPPLDVAYLEAGASMVVSTSAAVNDVVAGVFSCAFHFNYAQNAQAWTAFVQAGRMARGEHTSDDFDAWMSELWPSWTDSLEAALKVAPHDWMLFRLSGRHW